MTVDKKAALKKALANISGKFKDLDIDYLNELPRAAVKTISTGSLILDSILGGGAAEGRIIEVYGAEASGKTSIALTMAANVQRAGGTVVFLDVEQAFDPKYASALGVDLEELIFSQPTIAEETLQLILDLAGSGLVDMIILDSIPAMVPKAEADQDIEKNTIGLLARLLSKALKQITVAANKNNCTVVLLNQIRDKMGVMYGPSYDTTGGRALKYYTSQRIEVKRKGKVEDENGEIIGNEVFLKCIKNKIAPPYGEGLTVLTYAEGINKSAELFVLGEQLGVIQKEGRTYYCPYDGNSDISGYSSTLVDENNRVKIAVNAKPALKEIKENKALYDLVAKQVLDVLNKKNGLAT